MELVINLSMLGANPTGLGVYSENCARAIASRFDAKLIAGAGALPVGDVLFRAPVAVTIGGGMRAAIRRQMWTRSLSFAKGQLVYSPTHHGFPSIDGQIITVHDLICMHHPAQYVAQYLYFRFGLPKLLKKCRAVFTVSEATRQDVAKTYHYPMDDIFVVPNGVDVRLFSPNPAVRPDEPFLLMVGALRPHKNVDEVLDHAHEWSDRFRLIITACGNEYKAQLLRKIAALNIGHRVEFRDYVVRDELIKLYQGCSALVYPSLHEGFGIPPLEALACGTPVIASDIPVHREVLDDAAFFVKLGDTSSWARAFDGIRSGPEVAIKLQAAHGVLQRYTWANSADALERSLLQVEPKLLACRRDRVIAA